MLVEGGHVFLARAYELLQGGEVQGVGVQHSHDELACSCRMEDNA